MDLHDVAQRARLPIRRIRYVLEHAVMPGLRSGGGTGRPRDLTAFEGFWVAAAALLLHGGLQRRVVADMLTWLTATPWPPAAVDVPDPTPLERAVGRPRTAVEALYWKPNVPDSPCAVEIGDGAALRIQIGPVDTSWMAPALGARLDPRDLPRVFVRLDLAALRHAWVGAE